MRIYRRVPFGALTLMLALGGLVATGPPAAAAVAAGPRSTSPCASFVEVADVSQWQGVIDWPAYASQRAGVIIKATEGVSFKDPRFDQNAWGATLAGVAAGPYHFARPSLGDATREADWFVSVSRSLITARGPPPALDLEANDYHLSGGQLDAWALEFVHRVEALTGRRPIIYAGAYFAGFGADPELARYGLWIPAYLAGYTANPNPCTIGRPAVPNAWGGRGWDAWQFTSSNDTAGIRGHVDMSIVPPEVWAEWTGAGVEPNAPAADPAPAAPAQLVWGVGSHGAKVAQIQSVVGAAPDGVYGSATARAVARWQAFLGVGADGYWGPDTEQRTADLFVSLAALPPLELEPVPATVAVGARGEPVCELQRDLVARGYWLGVDCVFGPATRRVVVDWQGRNGLARDGVVGPATWGTL